MNRLDRRALSNRRLKRKLTDTAQIKSQRRQPIVRNKSLECVVDTNHAHVVGHGQARVLERGDNAQRHLVICRKHGSRRLRPAGKHLGRNPLAHGVPTVRTPIATQHRSGIDMSTTQRIAPTGLTKTRGNRVFRTRHKPHIRVTMFQQIIGQQLARTILVGVDRRAARMRIHGQDDRSHSRLGNKLLKIGSHAVHVENHAVDGSLDHAARGIGKCIGLVAAHLDHSDGKIVLARRLHDTLERRQVTDTCDVVHAQANRTIRPAAQRRSSKIGTKAQLFHGGQHTLARLFRHAGHTVDHARHSLAAHASERRNLCRARRMTIPCLLSHAFHANLLPNYSPRPWRIVHTSITCS